MLCSAQQVLLFLAATWVSSTVATNRCNDDIIKRLGQFKDCYEGGEAPIQKAGGNGTYVVATKEAIPAGVKCGTGRQDDGHDYATFYNPDDSIISFSSNARFETNYIEESQDGSKIKYHLYVIRNRLGAYAYYRCISSECDDGSPKVDVGIVAVGCKLTKDPDALAEVKRAKACFDFLGIKYEDLEPCEC